MLHHPASAQVIGGDIGLTAEATNLLLKEKGLLEGEPGAYSITEKGAAYGASRHQDGPTLNSPGHEVRTWKHEVRELLDLNDDGRVNDEKRRELYDQVSANRSAKRAAREAAAIDMAALDESGGGKVGPDGKQVLFAAGVVVTVVGGVYLAVKAAPRVKAWWHSRRASEPDDGDV